MIPTANDMRDLLVGLQEQIVAALEAVDTRPFARHPWSKAAGEPLGGSGITCILEEGHVFERAGVGFSHVTGAALPPSASAARPELAGRGFEAMGVSLVIHPRNPYVPTVHMNVRFFTARRAGADDVWWVGGGMDLTPYYGFREDATHFHQMCRNALDPFGADLHPRFKTWCDDYFFIKHRKEARGIGGIFLDDFSALGLDASAKLLRSIGEAFLAAYLPIVARRNGMPYGQRERQWQLVRRGRYVEFNLVLDRGTLFGLQSGGRTESILMSMPPEASWRYEHDPEPGSPEHDFIENFLPAQDWLL